MNMYVTLSSTCFGPWHAHLQEEQLHKHSIWYPRSTRRLHTIPLSTGIVCRRLVERGYQMLCLYNFSSWKWACQGPKHVEDNVPYMFILKCALKLVLKNILYYDARSEKHHIVTMEKQQSIMCIIELIFTLNNKDILPVTQKYFYGEFMSPSTIRYTWVSRKVLNIFVRCWTNFRISRQSFIKVPNIDCRGY